AIGSGCSITWGARAGNWCPSKLQILPLKPSGSSNERWGSRRGIGGWPSRLPPAPQAHPYQRTIMRTCLVLTVLLTLPEWAHAGGPQKPVKVFILAGQSNMEGKAKVSLLEYQAQQPATRDLFKHLRKNDKWIERDDVWIKYRAQKGKLTVGYGLPPCI